MQTWQPLPMKPGPPQFSAIRPAISGDIPGHPRNAEPSVTGQRERLYLAKLVLLLAREAGDPDRVRALATLALRDLD